jgi:hypothetical protein
MFFNTSGKTTLILSIWHFCDPFGIQKNKSNKPNSLQTAFENGVCIDAQPLRVSAMFTLQTYFLPRARNINRNSLAPQHWRVVSSPAI